MQDAHSRVLDLWLLWFAPSAEPSQHEEVQLLLTNLG